MTIGDWVKAMTDKITGKAKETGAPPQQGKDVPPEDDTSWGVTKHRE